MFDNLLYIFTKNNQNINNIKEIENMREIKRLNLILIKKNTELKILQYKYNKLLNNCIYIELNKKKDIVPDIVPDIIPDIAPDIIPDIIPDIAPDIASDIVPDIVPYIAPDIVPDIVPDITESTEINSDTDISQFNVDISEYEKI
jgi:hypothetical protein